LQNEKEFRIFSEFFGNFVVSKQIQFIKAQEYEK